MQDKYKDKLVVVLSHVVAYNKRAVLGSLKKTKVKFSCYQGLHLKKAPLTEDGIPHIVIFDHTGKIIEQDWEIEDLDKKIDKLVKAIK